MAKTKLLIAFLFFFMFISISYSSTYKPKRKQYKPCHNLVLYFHDILYNGKNAPNATSTIVGAPDKANLTILAGQNHFGNLVVFDDPLLLTTIFTLLLLAGLKISNNIYDTKNTFTTWLGFSFVLNTTNYEGSINFVGADPILVKTRDISVVGGTGDFFMHRGVATIMTDSYEGDMYFRLRVDIKFYEC